MSKDNDLVDYHLGYYDDDPEALAKELRLGLLRGDFITFKDRLRASWHARRAEALVLASWGMTPEGAAVRQARAAEVAAATSRLALGVAVLALAVSVIAYIRPAAPAAPAEPATPSAPQRAQSPGK
jgi:hypothetical protein